MENENSIPIPAQLKSAVVGGYVTSTDQIIDTTYDISQALFNQQVLNRLQQLDQFIWRNLSSNTIKVMYNVKTKTEEVYLTRSSLDNITDVYIDGNKIEIESHIDNNGKLKYPFNSIGIHEVRYVLNENCHTIDDHLFDFDTIENNELIEVYLPNDLTTIGEYAFGSTSIKTIELPNSLVTISESAFFCSSLESIIIPSSVTTIEGNPFEYCTKLESIKVNESNEYYDSRNNCNAIIEIGDNDRLITGCKNTSIPSSVKIIGEFAFSGINVNSTIIIPNGIEIIENGAFQGCTSLRAIYIPESVQSIGNIPNRDQLGNSFNGCVSLEDVVICSNDILSGTYSTLNTICDIFGVQVKRYYLGDAEGFSTSLPVPTNNISISEHAFDKSNNQIQGVYLGQKITAIGNSCFNSCNNLQLLLVNNSYLYNDSSLGTNILPTTNKENRVLLTKRSYQRNYLSSTKWLTYFTLDNIQSMDKENWNLSQRFTIINPKASGISKL